MLSDFGQANTKFQIVHMLEVTQHPWIQTVLCLHLMVGTFHQTIYTGKSHKMWIQNNCSPRHVALCVARCLMCGWGLRQKLVTKGYAKEFQNSTLDAKDQTCTIYMECDWVFSALQWLQLCEIWIPVAEEEWVGDQTWNSSICSGEIPVIPLLVLMSAWTWPPRINQRSMKRVFCGHP